MATFYAAAAGAAAVAGRNCVLYDVGAAAQQGGSDAVEESGCCAGKLAPGTSDCSFMRRIDA